MLRLSLIFAGVVVCALSQHAAHPPLPTYPPNHPARAAHDMIYASQNNPAFNPHHAEYFRSLGQTYNPGAPVQNPHQPAQQQASQQQASHPAIPPLPTHPPGHPAHQLHAQQLAAANAEANARNNPNYNPHHAAHYQMIGQPYNPQPPQQQQHYQAPQQQYQAPQQQYQAPQPQYRAPQQSYQAPNPAPITSNHVQGLQLSYDIGVGNSRSG